ncbi:TauD/TfdA family dioxygenase [Amycolatopsis acidicola]|uniref:TauD/TfdA dioxygenase family protein n=1 Tax=Amycolatopsis acidicola TaxID=2596893 RepID=UPI00312CC244
MGRRRAAGGVPGRARRTWRAGVPRPAPRRRARRNPGACLGDDGANRRGAGGNRVRQYLRRLRKPFPSGKERIAGLRVVHTFEAIQRRTYPNPTPAQEAEWASRPVREHPLVWRHESGRRSLVFGATASHIDGMGRSLLDELENRATAPDRVLRYRWSAGDTVMWDNTGLVHRACAFDRGRPRRMHRTTLAGREPIRMNRRTP